MISAKDVARVARLARISLQESEMESLAEQLSFVLKHFEQVATIDTENIPPLITPTEITVHLREDKVVTWPGADRALENAPETVGHLFKVPPVVG
jgi:aspartyl-tRNA(Asn)/glutamyl-tRNA(Gln) amidotransferase subunit C